MSDAELAVNDDNHDFYGKRYWQTHQTEDYAYPDIFARARLDLTDRCLHWLRTLCRYKLPGTRILELGAAHGGFVALCRLAGFDATGLELSPWVVAFARQTFDVPMLLGTVEEQNLEAHSLDAIMMMDVLEHLPHPTATLRRCVEMLKPDGILIIQTPQYRHQLYADMNERNDPFLVQFKPPEHLYLYTRESVQLLLSQVGLPYVYDEPAMYPAYDMFIVASRSEISQNHHELSQVLTQDPKQRFALALLDLDERTERDLQHLQRDADDRLIQLQNVSAQLSTLQERATIFETAAQERLALLEKADAEAHDLQHQIATLEQANALLEQMRQQVISFESTARENTVLVDSLRDELRKVQGHAETLETETRQLTHLAEERFAAKLQLESQLKAVFVDLKYLRGQLAKYRATSLRRWVELVSRVFS